MIFTIHVGESTPPIFGNTQMFMKAMNFFMYLHGFKNACNSVARVDI